MTLDFNARLTIDKLGQRGEGIAHGPQGTLYIPHALPGETIIAELDRDRAKLVRVENPSPDRIAPVCPHYTLCGGCAVQGWAALPYLAWKQALVADALVHAGITAPVSPVIDAHGEGRRRVTFHARTFHDARGFLHVETGFMQARAHKIIEIDACPILAPGLAAALAGARAVAKVLALLEKPLDIVISTTDTGLDVDIKGCGALDFHLTQKLMKLAEVNDFARISNHGAILLERRPPQLVMGRANLILPPGGFLQASVLGEETIAGLVLAATRKAKRVADLFAGVGTFALRLATHAAVHAVESDARALAACQRAAHDTPGLKALTGEARDLMVRPLTSAELDRFDALVFDPPRAGAQAQATQIARSCVPRVVAVSCNVQTFARDAKILMEGGYTLDSVTPVDQFRYSPHVEMVGVFSRPAAKTKKRGLLS